MVSGVPAPPGLFVHAKVIPVSLDSKVGPPAAASPALNVGTTKPVYRVLGARRRGHSRRATTRRCALSGSATISARAAVVRSGSVVSVVTCTWAQRHANDKSGREDRRTPLIHR